MPASQTHDLAAPLSLSSLSWKASAVEGFCRGRPSVAGVCVGGSVPAAEPWVLPKEGCPRWPPLLGRLMCILEARKLTECCAFQRAYCVQPVTLEFKKRDGLGGIQGLLCISYSLFISSELP